MNWMRGLAAAAIAVTAAIAGAQPAGLPYAPAEIRRTDDSILSTLAAERADIDNVNFEKIRVYFTWDEFNQALARGWDIQWIPDEAHEMSKMLRAEGKKQGKYIAGYHSYDELTTELQGLAPQYPSILRLSSAGQSVQGRELWFVKITDNPDLEEDEPEFKYISSMHGDEVLGMELMIDLIHRLVENYGTDTRITNLVNNTEIWIMPLMNPDGWMWASGAQRYNAHSVDLNRAFPSRMCGDTNSTSGREPEVVAIMNWGASHSEVLSANFHGGELVVNYPFDECLQGCNTSCTYSASADDDTFRKLALSYADPHPRLSTSTPFAHGITNGAEWYSAYGGMQDWNYYWNGNFELTIELDRQKTPSVERLPGLIAENRESVLAYMEWAQRGVRGIVKDGATNQPLAATVTVVGRDFVSHTDPQVGDYHRILAPGTYNLVYTTDAYPDPITVYDVTVAEGDATRVDVTFVPLSGSTSAWQLY